VPPIDAFDVQTSPPVPGPTGLSKQALEHYQRALQAQRNGNWALYGDEIRRLGEALEQMAGDPGQPPPPNQRP
jgi:uncharacterized membrane protein (UPF0182 family)